MSKDTIRKSIGNADETSTTNKSSRSKIGRSNEIIRDFLMSSQRYEADAIRVLLLAISRNPNIGELAFEDQTVLNRYLIDGLYKGECADVDDMKSYRQDKAAELMGAVGEYLDTRQQTIAVTKFLMKFASDNVMAKQAMNNLIPRLSDTKTATASSATPAPAATAQPVASQNDNKQ